MLYPWNSRATIESFYNFDDLEDRNVGKLVQKHRSIPIKKPNSLFQDMAIT